VSVADQVTTKICLTINWRRVYRAQILWTRFSRGSAYVTNRSVLSNQSCAVGRLF